MGNASGVCNINCCCIGRKQQPVGPPNSCCARRRRVFQKQFDLDNFLKLIGAMNTRRRPVAPAPNIYAINAKICRLVAEHPCLYDRSDEFYMRQSTVNEAWKDISKKMRNSG